MGPKGLLKVGIRRVKKPHYNAIFYIVTMETGSGVDAGQCSKEMWCL